MTIRGGILDQAKHYTEVERDAIYGDPVRNMTCFAKMVEGYLFGLGWTGPAPLDGVDGSMIMDLSKKTRIAANKEHLDSFPDGCAYNAIGGECAVVLLNKKEKSQACVCCLSVSNCSNSRSEYEKA